MYESVSNRVPTLPTLFLIQISPISTDQLIKSSSFQRPLHMYIKKSYYPVNLPLETRFVFIQKSAMHTILEYKVTSHNYHMYMYNCA